MYNQIDAAMVRIKDFFKKNIEKSYWPQTAWTAIIFLLCDYWMLLLQLKLYTLFYWKWF